jgi:hypothetical protein
MYENLGIYDDWLEGIWKDYLNARREGDNFQIENCCYWYTFIRDNALKAGDNVSKFPKKLKLPLEFIDN